MNNNHHDASHSPHVDNQFVRTRRLERNLRSDEVFRRLREAERYAAVGERELGFYLLDVKQRRLCRDAACRDFPEFVRRKTGLSQKKARDLVRVAEALESLPGMDAAFAQEELNWSAVRAMTT